MNVGLLLGNKPFIGLFVLSGMLLVISYGTFFISGDSTLDINIHDTYFVVAQHHILNFFSIWMALCGLGYYVLHKFKIRPFYWLTMAHIIVSILGILSFVFDFGFMDFYDNPTRYYQNTAYPYELEFFFRVFLFPIGQLVYFINITASTIKRNPIN